MPQIKTPKAQKEYKCSSCGDTIHKGEMYRKAKPFRRPPIVRCMKPGCEITQSQLTSSESMAAYYALTEGSIIVAENYESPEAICDDLETFADQITEAADVFGEVAERIEEGFQHETTQSEEIRGQGEEVESWADQVRSLASDVKDLEGDDWQDQAQTIIDEAYGGGPL